MGKSAKRQWHLGHALAVVAVGVLAAIVMPGCTWLFPRWQIATAEPGGHLLYPAPPPTISDLPSQFTEPSSGYRSLGGVFIFHSQLMIVKAPGEAGTAPGANDVATGLAFGRLVAEHHIDRITVKAEDCIGAGTWADPLKLRDLVDLDDEIAWEIACARLRNPGARWIGSNLMANGERAVSQVLLERQDETQIGLYVDVSRFAIQHGALR